MATASELFFGTDIPRNCDALLQSPSVIEFWQRWHIPSRRLSPCTGTTYLCNIPSSTIAGVV
jgi:hypothetical protein